MLEAMHQHELSYYIDRYLEGSITADEWVILQELAADPAQEEALRTLMDAQLLSGAASGITFPQVVGRLKTDLLRRVQKAPEVRSIRRRWSQVAAAVILLLGTGLYFWIASKRNPQPIATTAADIAPGKHGAILTLADGSQVLLDTVENGIVALQGGVAAKVVNGTLQYEGKGSEVMYNTISIPKGRQFRMTLPDGTAVWLNSATMIRYPTRFNGKERRITVSGEAYFEVAQHAGMPFFADLGNNAEVKVLGTHFNVNTYENEQHIAVTLLKGSVKVAGAGSTPVILEPGRQAQIGKTHIKVVNANLDRTLAWKNGLFYFEGATLPEVMRQLERWYDIEVVYEKGVPDVEFVGEMSRGVPLSGLLIVLKKLDVHYRLEGRKLTILP